MILCNYMYVHIYIYRVCIYIYIYVNITITAIEVNGDHVINGGLIIVRSGHYSADGDDYDYYRASTEAETVSSTGPLVNPVTVQVCTHIITFMLRNYFNKMSNQFTLKIMY